MRNARSPEYGDYTLEQLAAAYQQLNDYAIFAEAFEKSYLLLVGIANRVPGISFITVEDRITYMLIHIDKALKTYSPEKKIKFTSYVGRCYRNQLLTLFKTLSTNSRRINLETDCCDDISVFDSGLEDERDFDFILAEYFDPSDLSYIEKRFLVLSMAGYRIQDVKEICSWDNSTIGKIRRSLKRKLQLTPEFVVL
jgi:hypothetical protein